MIIYNAIAILYVLSGLWCSFQPLKSMGFLGYAEVRHIEASVAEFVTVYGGLQLGIGLAMLTANLFPQYYGGTLLFAAVLSLLLIFMRVVSMMTYGWFEEGLMMGGLELVLAVSLAVLFYRQHQLV